jgi:peptidoglycan/LPS O-acetylase OafA/YrhL
MSASPGERSDDGSEERSDNDVGAVKIKGRLDYIDVLRALAVLSVVSVHVWGYWLNSPIQEAHGVSIRAFFYRWASLGSWGVDLFIVISGFCLAHPLFKSTDRSTPPRDLRIGKFYTRRAWRILPAYYVAVLLFFVIELFPKVQPYLVGRPVNAWDLTTHLLLIQTWFGSTIGAINGPFWSIALEAQLYLAFPLLLLFIRKWGFTRAIGITVAVALAWFALAGVWGGMSISHTFGPDLSKELPARWFEFALGVGAARLVTAPRRSDLRLGLVAMVVGLPVALAGESLNSAMFRAFGYGVLAFGLVVTCAFLPHRVIGGNPVGRTVQKLGVISFSFYLIHQPALLLMAPLVRRLHVSGEMELLLGMTVGVAVVTLAAWVYFRLVEKPFLIHGGMRDAIVDPAPSWREDLTPDPQPGRPATA